jgi:hypothetical protein
LACNANAKEGLRGVNLTADQLKQTKLRSGMKIERLSQTVNAAKHYHNKAVAIERSMLAMA